MYLTSPLYVSLSPSRLARIIGGIVHQRKQAGHHLKNAKTRGPSLSSASSFPSAISAQTHPAGTLDTMIGSKHEAMEPAFSIFSAEAKRFPLILTLDQNGIPHRWVTWQHAVWYYAKERVAWETGSAASASSSRAISMVSSTSLARERSSCTVSSSKLSISNISCSGT